MSAAETVTATENNDLLPEGVEPLSKEEKKKINLDQDKIKESIDEIKKQAAESFDKKNNVEPAKPLSFKSFDSKAFNEIKVNSVLDNYSQSFTKRREVVLNYLAKEYDEFIIQIKNPQTRKYEDKPFQYNECTMSEWDELQKKQSKFADINLKLATMRLELERLTAIKAEDREKIDFDKFTELADKARDEFNKLYKDGAKIFLGMSENDYNNASRPQLILAVDVCNHRTQYSLPNLEDRDLLSSSIRVTAGTS